MPSSQKIDTKESFNPRTYERCDLILPHGKIAHGAVSIRAPTRGAMATHSKIRPFRAPFTPLRQQNRRILGNPFPLTHPYVRPLKEKTSRFYDHLRFALERSFGAFHYLCRGCKFSAAHAQRPFLVYPITQPSDRFDLT